MNIGIICYPSVGGSGVVATNLGNELAKLGHEIHFISYEQPFRVDLHLPNIHFHKVNINRYELFKYPDYTLPLAVNIGKVHEDYKLDIVHVHYAVPHATAALLACQMLEQCVTNNSPKIITTLHGTDITLLAQDPNLFSIIKYSIERSDGVTAVSQSLQDETLQTLKTKKPIEVIYNFYNPIPPTINPEKIRTSLKIKKTDFVALHMSNLREVKRIPDLLKITAELRKNPAFKLLILAGGDFKQYEKEVKKLKIQKNIVVKNNIKDIENYINAADCGIYASDHESFGMGILESMAYGKPVIATNAGGVPEVLRDNQDGFLVKVGDIKNFTGKLKMLIKNPQLRQELGRSAFNHAVNKFSTNVVVGQYLNYYQKILKDN